MNRHGETHASMGTDTPTFLITSLHGQKEIVYSAKKNQLNTTNWKSILFNFHN